MYRIVRECAEIPYKQVLLSQQLMKIIERKSSSFPEGEI